MNEVEIIVRPYLVSDIDLLQPQREERSTAFQTCSLFNLAFCFPPVSDIDKNHESVAGIV